jgi:hypothetical protein
MAAITEKEMMEIADQYIDKQFPTPLGNKKNWELKDRRAIEFTLVFVAGFSRGLDYAIKKLKS